jgi:TRAP-type C4-dicarboxylate transport system permease small subunit
LDSGKEQSALERGIGVIIRPLTWLAFVVVAVMVLIVFVNVVGRYVFNWPLLGTIELVEIMMAIIAAIAMAYGTIRRMHVRVNILILRLPGAARKVLDRIVYFLNAAIFGVLAHQALMTAIEDMAGFDPDKMIATNVLFIPTGPFRFVLFIGFLAVSLVSLFFVFKNAPEEKI